MKTHSPSSLRTSGFTLMEIMIVVAIIAVLATMVAGGMGWYKRKAAIGKTTVLLGSMERALEDYRSENGAFPVGDGSDTSSEELYKALYGDGDADGKSDNGATVYLDVLDPSLRGTSANVKEDEGTYTIVDAWDNVYRYQSPGVMNPEDDFDLWSLGPDGKGGPNTGTEKERSDDIKNW